MSLKGSLSWFESLGIEGTKPKWRALSNYKWLSLILILTYFLNLIDIHIYTNIPFILQSFNTSPNLPRSSLLTQLSPAASAFVGMPVFLLCGPTHVWYAPRRAPCSSTWVLYHVDKFFAETLSAAFSKYMWRMCLLTAVAVWFYKQPNTNFHQKLIVVWKRLIEVLIKKKFSTDVSSCCHLHHHNYHSQKVNTAPPPTNIWFEHIGSLWLYESD